MRHALLSVVLLTLTGCAALPFGERITTSDLEQRGREDARSVNGFAFGHGVGDTPGEARQMAAEELARQLLTHVRSEVRITERELQREEEREHVSSLERELESSAAAMANAALEGVETDLEMEAEDGWYVRLRIDQRRMEELRQRARRQAPALAQFELTTQYGDDRPGLRLRAALRGLAVVERTGVRDEQVYHPATGATTFGSYFQQVVVDSVEALRVVPLVDDDRVRFAVVHAETLAPQPGLAIEVGTIPLRTGRDGLTDSLPRADLSESAAVHAVGYSERLGDGAEGERWAHPGRSLLYVTNIDPADWEDSGTAEVLVHTEPTGVLASLGDDERMTPARFRVPTDRTVRLVIPVTDEHRGHSETIDIPDGTPYAYTSVSLAERHFGQLRLEAEGRGSRIRVEGRNGEWQTTDNRFSEVVDAGRYDITIFREENGDYQRINDQVTVLEDQTLERDYVAPRYREPYTRGSRFTFSLLRFGGEPLSGYTLPWAFGDDLDYEEFADDYGASEDGLNIDLMGQGQRFTDTLNIAFQGEFGLRNRSFTIGREDPGDTGERDILTGTDEGDLSLSGFHMALGAGFWRTVGDGAAWLTLNQALETMSWSEDSQVDVCRGSDYSGSALFGACDGELDTLTSGSVSNSYRFVELGLAMGGGWNMALRVPEALNAAHLMVGFGGVFIDSGYAHPAATNAARGRHYR
ncbi:MAG: hypothetical protein ACQERR_07660 [Pseudomonadota bacterium]